MKEVKHVKSPMIFNQEELAQRKEVVKDRYMSGYYQSYQYSPGNFVYPATELHSFTSNEDLVDFAIEKALQGQTRFKQEPMQSGIGYFAIRIYKPQHEIEADLEVLYQEAEEAYRKEIEEHNEAMKALLAEQLLNAEIAKEERKEQERLAKMKAKAEAEAQEYYNALIKEQN
ncbi:hypothetical protein ACSX1C_00305 [Pseudomonas sp. MBLB4123]|uniref:hypothetical protein n=1 Tax=Pseudomonas sp. MBLB4123 TaxID=3451557 RepID=UPI003F74B91A